MNANNWNYQKIAPQIFIRTDIKSNIYHVGSMLPSFRNQSVDLDSKSIDWLLYECNIDLTWVNGLMSNLGRDGLTFREYLIY